MVSAKTVVLWTIEHRVFSYDSCAKNSESVAAVQREFPRRFNIHRYDGCSNQLHHLTLGECTSYTRHSTKSEICWSPTTIEDP